MGYLLDTDTCSAHLKQNAAVSKFVMQYAGRLHVSVVSSGELMTWASRKNAGPQRLAGLLDFIRGIEVLPVTPPIAEEYGRLRAALLDAGHPTPEMDLWIAATAVHYDSCS